MISYIHETVYVIVLRGIFFVSVSQNISNYAFSSNKSIVNLATHHLAKASSGLLNANEGTI